MSRATAPLVLVAALVAIGGLSATTLHFIHRREDALATARGGTERVIAYRATTADGPSFRLEGERNVLVETYALWPAGPFDPAREVSYGLIVAIRAGGREVWRRTLQLESRQSKERVAGRVVAEATRAVDDEIELADERVVTLLLPEVPFGAELSVRAVGPVPEVLVRLFSRSERDHGARVRLARRLDPSEAIALTSPITYTPWALEDDEDRLGLLRFRHERLSALGERDADYRIRRIDVTPLRTPIRLADAEPGFDVAPGRDAIVNLRGPAPVELWATPDDPATSPRLRLTAVSEGAPIEPIELGGPPAASHRLALPTGIHSLRIASDVPTRVRLRAPAVAAIGPARPVAPTGPAGPAGDVWVEPDRVRFDVDLTDAGRPPLVVELGVGEVGTPIAEVVRLDSRALSPRPSEAASCTTTVVFRAASGRPLARHELPLVDATTDLEQVDDGRATRFATDPISSRFVVPAGAARLEVSSPDACAHRFYRIRPGQTELELPYRDVPLTLMRFRYARLARRVWFALHPGARTADAGAERAELSAQVRLEPPGEDARGGGGGGGSGSGDPNRVATALIPEGAPEQQRVREPVAVARRAALAAAWPPGALTPVVRPTAIRFAADAGGAPRLFFQAPISAVGGAVALTLDGAPWLSAELPTATGHLRLATPPPGRHVLAATAPDGTRLWIDRPPARAGDPIERLRTLYPLEEEPIRVRVAVRAGERVFVNAVVYAPRVSRDALAIQIDDGRPRRRAGVSLGHLTEADRRVALPPPSGDGPAVLIDLGERAAGYARVVPVGVMEDVVAGPHVISVRRVASTARSGAPMWIRFFVSRVERPTPGPVVQWRTREADEVTVAP